MPILSVFFGIVFLKESYNKQKIISVFLVIISVTYLLFNYSSVPWTGLIVALTWSIYSLLRKKISVESDVGLLIESLFISPLAVIVFYLIALDGNYYFSFSNPEIAFWLFLAGPMTVIPLFLFLTLTSDDRRRTFRNALICFLCCAVPVSAWIARNVAVDDLWGVTEGRGEIAVSAREIYNDMTFTEYFAAMVYWTRIKGDGLAHRLFSQETLGKLRHDTSDGFFQRGHKRFSELVERKKTAENISYEAASKEVYDQLFERVLKRPVRHFFTTALLAYRGVWIDQFAPFGVLASFFITVSAARRRNYVVLFALCPSLFAFIFYPLISLNVPRYQMVTIPAFALVSGMFAVRFNNKLMEVKKRWSSRNFLKRKGERHSI